ncbi:Eco57I restriction-modification methylase domain-containing protein [Halorussus halobius]|uniref:Eco57I restriction-modification methylase domain-containing protein n=1 Tax=Halorussus halobius TaxID=1710537 RepID=UPI001091CD0C|nr:TaqI-like C-terminal specificity domain-containing protein [Halorussus halobius]
MSQSTLSRTPFRNSNLFSGYYLDERIHDRDEWADPEGVEAAFERLQDLYETERELVEGHKEDALIDSWIDPVLDVLGYGARSEATLPDGGGYVDRLLFESEETRREAEMEGMDAGAGEMFKRASAVMEAKQWGANFTERFDEDRQYRDASHQVKFYLERTPEPVRWGILTNGKKWRLYGTKDYETQTYYEVDLPELLDAGNLAEFKYFYLFFRPQAFAEVAGTSFLDSVWNESETAAQELGEDLQDNVFTALRVLGKGFVETNDLDIDPDDEAALDELKEQSLVLLYRLMFILYAESRQLVNPDDPEAEREYDENFSLDQRRLEILETVADGETFDEAYSEFSTVIWQRLRNLFELIDEGNDALGVTAYNGGLFDADDHEFLADNEVSDRYLAEVIYRLSTTETDDGEFVLADYADLDTRHLGSIYEGLLEHEFRIAPEQYAAVAEDGGQVWKPATEVSVADAVETVPEGSLYVVNDEGERKATGAYYTPDYVVTYIVEETVDPLIEEIEDDLAATDLEPGTVEYVTEFWKRVRELRILDPAMGSGHFLTKATGYVAEQVMAEVRELETATLFDEEQIRRAVSKECIYGVDRNGMAVELAKLSMWLETLSSDQPLAFLDHHLKTGNSLVGSDITEILSTDDDGPSGQTTLSDWLTQTRREALEQVMDRMQDLLAIENDSLADIKEMEQMYADIREDSLFVHLLEMASVHTAGQFGLDVPDDADERMAKALRDDSWADVSGTDWFESAQAMAAEERFFHWQLEFPEVFFSESGAVSDEAGFDAVVGNPPYIRSRNLPESQKSFYKSYYESAEGAFDIYILFLERFGKLSGTSSFIIPNKWTTTNYGREIRNILLDDYKVSDIVDVSNLDVFPDADIYPVIVKYSGSYESDSINIKSVDHPQNITTINSVAVPHDFIDELGDRVIPVNLESSFETIAQKALDFPTRLADHVNMTECIHTGNVRDKLVVEEKQGDECEKLIGGNDISRYEIDWDDRWVRYDESLIDSESGDYGDLRDRDIFDREEKLFIRDISYRPVAVYDDDSFFALNTLYSVRKTDETELPLRYILGVFNSEFVNKFYRQMYGGNHVSGGYLRFKPMFSYNIPIPTDGDISDELQKELESQLDNTDRDVREWISYLTKKMEKHKKQINNLNLSLLDHLRIDPESSDLDGPTITEIGFSQPPANSADSILNETTETRTKLQIERAKVERESPNSVTVHLTARYKPDEDEADEDDLDQYGYTETEFLPALRITDLSETEADLVEAFVPVAVEEAGGFAGFRDNATKTNSLLDRLEKLTLPAVADVERGLESYVETSARAADLDEKIERTDDLIDEIVYELYGLTDEEIEIVEDAVGE